MSFRSLDIIHARSNITMADCKKRRKLRPEAAVLMQWAYTRAGQHRLELPRASERLHHLAKVTQREAVGSDSKQTFVALKPMLILPHVSEH